jgi:hypothetical protein
MARAKKETREEPEVVASSEGVVGSITQLVPLPAETVVLVWKGADVVAVARTRAGGEAVVAGSRKRDKGFPADYRLDERTVEG